MAAIVRLFLLCLSLILICEDCHVEGRKGFGGTKQDWGYITVRPNAHMFWWLYYTTARVSNYTERPLIIWLQGGPGMPSSGYGVFAEIGPLDVDLNPREHTWVKDYNVLFVDNPIGVGFSYSANDTKHVGSNEEIGLDLVYFLEGFLSEHPQFQDVPMYFFGESYGGKMVVEFAYQLVLRQRKQKIRCNLQGIALGDSYISPIDYIVLYGPVGYQLGFLDKKGLDEVESTVSRVKSLLNNGSYEEAADAETLVTATLSKLMSVDLYNFNERVNTSVVPTLWKHEETLNELLNKQVKPALNMSDDMEWSFFTTFIYSDLKNDFLKPVTDKIEALLNNTDIEIIVYNGVLDLLVNTAGTSNWIYGLNWKHKEEWTTAPQEVFVIDSVTEGYVKRVGNLVFYTVFRAGHSVPIDNPAAMTYILSKLGTESNGDHYSG